MEFLPDASYKAIQLNLRSARLDPRDVSLFAERKGYNNQQATLVPRAGAILFRTEIARAIIHSDRALVFASRCGSLPIYTNPSTTMPCFSSAFLLLIAEIGIYAVLNLQHQNSTEVMLSLKRCLP